MIDILARLKNKGRTIVLSIHQPRVTIFNHFDWLILLSEGEIAYQGPSNEVLDYFSKWVVIGYYTICLTSDTNFYLLGCFSSTTCIAARLPFLPCSAPLSCALLYPSLPDVTCLSLSTTSTTEWDTHAPNSTHLPTL